MLWRALSARRAIHFFRTTLTSLGHSMNMATWNCEFKIVMKNNFWTSQVTFIRQWYSIRRSFKWAGNLLQPVLDKPCWARGSPWWRQAQICPSRDEVDQRGSGDLHPNGECKAKQGQRPCADQHSRPRCWIPAMDLKKDVRLFVFTSYVFRIVRM